MLSPFQSQGKLLQNQKILLLISEHLQPSLGTVAHCQMCLWQWFNINYTQLWWHALMCNSCQTGSVKWVTRCSWHSSLMDYLVKEAIIKSLQMGSTNNTHTERTVSGPIRVNGIEFLLSAFIFVKQTNKKKKVCKVPCSNENSEWKEFTANKEVKKLALVSSHLRCRASSGYTASYL